MAQWTATSPIVGPARVSLGPAAASTLELWFTGIVASGENPYRDDSNRCELQTEWLIARALDDGVDLTGAHVLWLTSAQGPHLKAYLNPAPFDDKNAQHGWTYHVFLERGLKTYDLGLAQPERCPPLDVYVAEAVEPHRRHATNVVEVPVRFYRERIALGESAIDWLHQHKSMSVDDYLAARASRLRDGIQTGVSGE